MRFLPPADMLFEHERQEKGMNKKRGRDRGCRAYMIYPTIMAPVSGRRHSAGNNRLARLSCALIAKAD